MKNLRMSPLNLILCFTVASLFVITGSSSALSPGEELDLKIIVCQDEPIYKSGDKVRLTICVFLDGELMDPDKNYPELTVNPSGGNDRKIDDIEKQEKGIYLAQFTIKDEDVDQEGSYDDVEYFVKIKYQDKEEIEYGEIDIESKSVLIAVSNTDPQPGDTIDITVMVYDGARKVTVDELDLEMRKLSKESYYNDELFSPDSEELKTSMDSKGIYKASYTIDADIKEGTVFYITAVGKYKDEGFSGARYLQTMFYDVWYKEIREGDGIKEIEVYVVDQKGNAVEGASIKLNYESEDSNDATANKIDSVTDSSGKAEFTIPLDSDHVHLFGDVIYQEKTQFFNGMLFQESEVGDQHYGFEVEAESGEDFEDEFLNPGAEVTRKYTAYFEGERIKKEEINYYIYSDCYFIDNGKITTNEEGKFELSFRVSKNFKSEDIRLEFEKEYDYKRTDSDYISVYGTHLDISVNKFKVGGESKLTVDVPIGDIYSVILIWEIVDSEYVWGSMVRGQFSYLFIINTGERNVDLMVPEFLPHDKSYKIVGYGGRPSETTPMSMNYIIVKHGESISTTDSGEENEKGWFKDPLGFYVSDMPLTLLLVIVIAVIVIIGAVLKTRRAGMRAGSGARLRKSGNLPPPPPDEDEYEYDDDSASDDFVVFEPSVSQAATRPSTPPPPPPPEDDVDSGEFPCEHCGGDLEYVEEYDQWFCYKCKKYSFL